MAKTFVLSDESKINDCGFRTWLGGLDITQFKKNPIMLWMHNRAFRGTTEEVLPLGRWDNVRIEGEEGSRKLLAEAIFDEKDEFAKKIAQKVEDGFLRMASVGMDCIASSPDAKYLLEGQIRPTLIKAKLFEASIVDVGSDDGAIALRKDGKLLTLSAGVDHPDLPLLNNNLKENEMKTVALALGLQDSATEAEILSAVSALLAAKQTLSSEIETIKLSGVTAAVDEAIANKKVTADKKEQLIQLGKTLGLAQLNETLALIPSVTKPTQRLNLSHGNGTMGAMATDAKKLSELSHDDRVQLRSEDRETYSKLYKAEYGVAPTFQD